MASVTKSVVVQVPARVAYNQWTQMESFPQFMQGVKEVHQIDDKHMRWVAEVGGKRQEWDAEIIEQLPDNRIAWTSTRGDYNAGVVSFRSLDNSSCQVTLQLEYEPQGAIENVGSALGFLDRLVEDDLDRFKIFIESQGYETGAWRGEIQNHPETGQP